MTSLVLDTHAAIWYLATDARLSIEALQAIRAAAAAGKPCFVPFDLRRRGNLSRGKESHRGGRV